MDWIQSVGVVIAATPLVVSVIVLAGIVVGIVIDCIDMKERLK